MLALSIRQPYAELIPSTYSGQALRGIKTAELRSHATKIIGRRFYIYAAKAKARPPIWSDDLRVGRPPAWMIELAKQVKLIPPDAELPTGVIVGCAVIERVTPIEVPHPNPLPEGEGIICRWHFGDVRRSFRLRKPVGPPQPVWFNPF